MTRFNFTETINAPKHVVWEKVADLGYIQNFNPGVTKSYYNTDEVEGVGAGRICHLAPMGVIEETASAWEDGKSFTLEIYPVEKVPFFKHATATFVLSEVDGNTTQVNFDMRYEMKGVIGRFMDVAFNRKRFKKGMQGILMGLKAHVETGRVIHTFTDLRPQVAFSV